MRRAAPPLKDGGAVSSQVARGQRVGPNAAVAVAVLGCAGAVAIVLVLRVVNRGMEPVGQNWWLAVELMLGCAYLPVGVWLLSRHKAPAPALYFVVVGVSQLVAAVCTEFVAYAAFRPDDPLGTQVARELGGRAGLLATGLLAAFVPLVLPAGILPNRCWRPVVIVAAACVGLSAADGIGGS